MHTVWKDTQIGKQLRQLNDLRGRVFSTEIGLRPAEPCSLSVAATHQMLTQILLLASMRHYFSAKPGSEFF